MNIRRLSLSTFHEMDEAPYVYVQEKGNSIPLVQCTNDWSDMSNFQSTLGYQFTPIKFSMSTSGYEAFVMRRIGKNTLGFSRQLH